MQTPHLFMRAMSHSALTRVRRAIRSTCRVAPALFTRCLGLLVVLAGLLGFNEQAHAARTINSVTLNGAASVTVAPGDSVTVVINVTTTGSGTANDWRGTGWRISTTPPGTLTCWDHANHTSAGTYNETTTIAAPTTPGTYNAYFVAYDNDGCSTGASPTAILTSGVIVVAPPLLINSVTLNGAASVVVGANGAVTAVVNATTNASLPGYQWRSTAWRIATTAPGALTCVNHANHDAAGTFDETFTITAPAASGVYNAYFIAYNDDSCGAGASPTATMANAVTIPSLTEFNSTGGNTSTNGLHFYMEDTTKIQVRRLDNTGQVYLPTAIPPSNSLDNGVFIRANGLVYGPSHTVGGGYTPNGGMYNTYAITPASPANPSSPGVLQTATGTFGITSGPQVSVLWKYTTPFDFLIAEVTLTIPAGYTVSAANPVRYYHVFDTYLGGSDNGCGVSFIDANGKRVIGTYPPASGTTCPSSTAIPAGVSVVESFRERSGQTFSSYCASGWASFFDTSTPNCSVRQSASMSNTVVTTYQDTGIGIELDFTAPGTYTFSYDFVIGSPNVPPYDHLEIRHDGSGTMCPEKVTVLACTSATVPCPLANIVNTGTLTGLVTTTPAAPSVTKTPATFTLGSTASTLDVTLQAAAPGGAITLGTSGLSTLPLNGTKCWNTATASQSCALTFANTPCVSNFECLETGAAYNNLVSSPALRNPLYTKLTGTPFSFDVVALQSDGAVATSYTAAANVTVELFDDSAAPAPACDAYAGPVASQAITFAAGDLGRRALATPINLANAFGKLRCRVRDTNLSPTVYGCSSDDFSVRPQQFTLSAPVLTNTTHTGTPKAVAGTAFALDANAGVAAGYSGTAPVIDVTKVMDHANVTIAGGTLSGVFSGGTGAKASGAGFKYLDVGNIKFLTDAVVDSGFTSVDQPNDCVAGSTSTTLAGGKYGCNIGSATSPLFGRWYPSHYSFAGALTPACVAGNFTYMDQDALQANLTLRAHASTGAAAAATDPVTSRYASGGYTNLAPVTITGDNGGAAVAVTRLTNPAFAAMPNTALWSAGLFQINDTYSFAKLAGGPDGPYDLFKLMAALADPDGSILIGTAAQKETNATAVRYGRLRLQNAYGSELLALPVPLEAQFWTAGGFWARNALDNCTQIPASSIVMTFDAGALSACETQLSPAGNLALAGGRYLSAVAPFGPGLTLTRPGAGNSGSVNLAVNVGTVAAGNTCIAAAPSAATAANMPWFGPNLGAKATFGIYKSPLIYRRENY